MSDFKKPYGGKPAGQTSAKTPFKRTPYKGAATRDTGNSFSAPRTTPNSVRRDDDKPPPKLTGRPVLRIDMSAVKDNYRALEKLAARRGKPVTIGACVKADAYGIGMGPVAKALYGMGCRSFFVAHANEGRLLREIVGKSPSIYVFNGPSEAEMQTFFGSKLKPVLNTLDQARLWTNAIGKHEFQPRTAIHIDTGMNRLGFSAGEFEKLAADKGLLGKLDVELVMSHLACAPSAAHPMNIKQLSSFKKAAATLPPVTLSIANSAGMYLGKDYHFNMVRPGAALYGLQVTDDAKQEVTRPVVTLAAPILQIRHVPAGESLGYNATYTTKRLTRAITVGAGYADGIPVAMSNKSYAMIGNQKLPIIGRVSMDLTIIDATDFKGELKAGQQVTFLGNQLEGQTRDIGALNYEMLTRLGNRFRKEYI